MSILIKGGLIYSMTNEQPFVGDVLVQDNRIAAVAPQIDLQDESISCVLDANGLTILPGLIDAQIHDGPEVDEHILKGEHSSGVTAGLLWPEDEGYCQLLFADEVQETKVYVINPARYTDAQLHERLLSLAETGCRVAVEVRSAQACRRLLQLVHSSRVKLLLAQLNGCEDMLEAIALSGCQVILGVSGTAGGRPWATASKLAALQVDVSLTCGFPNAKLRYLPLCAALCVRDGMDRKRSLKTITTAPAAILRRSDVGRIAEGCRADLAIYDGDPLLLATSHVMTIDGGKIRH